jgi:hypothetical protein
MHHSFTLILILLTLIGQAMGIDMTLDEIKKMSIKTIRKELSARGLACTACTEKSEYVSKLYENQHLEIQIESEPPIDDKSKKDADLDKLMEQLKASGMNAEMFTAGDFAGKTPDEIADQMNGRERSRGRSRTSSSRKSSRKSSSRKSSTSSSRSKSKTKNSNKKERVRRGKDMEEESIIEPNIGDFDLYDDDEEEYVEL